MLGSALLYSGLVLALLGFFLPARESRVDHPETRLDEFAPAWQFHEVHSLRIDAPPAHVYEAIKQVRADEILLFRTLTWIRRGGRSVPQGILNPGNREPLLDAAAKSGFYYLADDAPREMVVQTKIGPRILATMNFLVRPDGAGSVVTTETRVLASTPWARRRFAKYWRVIYPGSALIRRMWLRAIAKRATTHREIRPSP